MTKNNDTNNNYIIFRNKKIKAPLLARDGFYDITTDGRVLLQVHSCTERLFLYFIFVGRGKSEISCWLRLFYNKKITPPEIDAIYDQVIKDHPPETVESYDMSEIPIYASENEGLIIPLPGTYVTISIEQEKELVQMILDKKGDSIVHIAAWFRKYRNEYSLNTQKESKCWDIDRIFAHKFLHQHGLCEETIGPKFQELPEVIERKKVEKKKIEDRAVKQCWISTFSLFGSYIMWHIVFALIGWHVFWEGYFGVQAVLVYICVFFVSVILSIVPAELSVRPVKSSVIKGSEPKEKPKYNYWKEFIEGAGFSLVFIVFSIPAYWISIAICEMLGLD